jgi:hypothetical protein
MVILMKKVLPDKCANCGAEIPSDPEAEARDLAALLKAYPGLDLSEYVTLCETCLADYKEWERKEIERAQAAFMNPN